MWNAIKSDLFEFVAQVQEDAQETLSKVVDLNTGRNHDDEEKISEEERILADFRNNFDTYSEVRNLLLLYYYKSSPFSCLCINQQHIYNSLRI